MKDKEKKIKGREKKRKRKGKKKEKVKNKGKKEGKRKGKERLEVFSCLLSKGNGLSTSQALGIYGSGNSPRG